MPGIASARCCHGVLCSFLNTATAPNAMIPTASRPAMENMAIGPQFSPCRTLMGAVGLRPLPPPALTGPRAPGRPADCRTPGRAPFVGVAPAVRVADLVAAAFADASDAPDAPDPEARVEPDRADVADDADRAGEADFAGRAAFADAAEPADPAFAVFATGVDSAAD